MYEKYPQHLKYVKIQKTFLRRFSYTLFLKKFPERCTYTRFRNLLTSVDE